MSQLTLFNLTLDDILQNPRHVAIFRRPRCAYAQKEHENQRLRLVCPRCSHAMIGPVVHPRQRCSTSGAIGPCVSRCVFAKNKRCQCACNGHFHGQQTTKKPPPEMTFPDSGRNLLDGK